MKKTVTVILFCVLCINLIACTKKDEFASKEKPPEGAHAYSDSNKPNNYFDCDDSYFYYFDIDVETQITTFYKMRLSSNTTQPEKIIEFEPYRANEASFAAVGEYGLSIYKEYILFYNNEKNTIYKMSKDGQNISPLFNEGRWTPENGMTISNGKILFRNVREDNTEKVWNEGDLYCMEIDDILAGNQPIKKHLVETDEKTQDYSYGYALRNGQLQTYRNGKSKDVFASTTLLANGEFLLEYYRSCIVTHQYIFYIDYESYDYYVMWRCDLDGSNKKRMSVFDGKSMFYTTFVNYDNNSVYFQYREEAESPFTLYRISTNGEKVHRYEENELDQTFNVNVFGDRILSNKFDGKTRLFLMNRDGSNFTKLI